MKITSPTLFGALALCLFMFTFNGQAQTKDTLYFRDLEHPAEAIIIQKEGRKELYYYLDENGPIRSTRFKEIDYISYADGFKEQIGPGQLLLNKRWGASMSIEIVEYETSIGNLMVDYMFANGIDVLVKLSSQQYYGGARYFINYKSHSRIKAAFGLLLGTKNYNFSYEYLITEDDLIYSGSGTFTKRAFASRIPFELSYVGKSGFIFRTELAYNWNYAKEKINDIYTFKKNINYANLEVGIGYRF
ncbi:hypothetical protein N9L20_04075 [Flavobacteriaceae bacterium]|nr:hypothetical protein [Flavobacteriaceae bacterium]